MIATLLTKNSHPYIQASSATGINYYQYLDNKIDGHIYANNFKFDYKADYDIEYNTNIIFIGDKKECIIIKIMDDDKTTAYIQSYKNFSINDINNSLHQETDTMKFMNTTLEYLRNKQMNKVILTDNTMLYLSNKKIFICILYLLQHGGNYFIDNFNFEYIQNNKKILYNKNKELLKTHYCNKSDIIKYMLLQYEQELVDKLVSTIKDNELVTNWLKTYIPIPEMYDIYIDCITYLFSQRPYTLLQGEMLGMSMLHPMAAF